MKYLLYQLSYLLSLFVQAYFCIWTNVCFVDVFVQFLVQLYVFLYFFCTANSGWITELHKNLNINEFTTSGPFSNQSVQ